MVGRILPETAEVKVGLLTKKSQNKSFFFTADNYKQRVFVLDARQLAYYGGDLEKRGDEKCTISLDQITAVETVQDRKSPHGFQVAYEEDGKPYILYIFAQSSEERDDWIKVIREESMKNGAYFMLYYHTACWDRQDGFSCCGAPSRSDEGCMPVTKHTEEMRERLLSKSSSTNAGEIMVDMMCKRSQGKSYFFHVINYKERVFVLNSCSLRYFDGNLRKREGEKGCIELCSVLAVENVKDELLDGRKNAFTVIYEDDDDEKRSLIIVARTKERCQAWIQAIRDEARRNNAAFQLRYHPGIWVKQMGKYNCCNSINKETEGCEPVTVDLRNNMASPGGNGIERMLSPRDRKVGMLIKRAQCKSAFYISKSFRERLFVLNNTRLRYFKGTNKKRKEEKGSIPLANIIVVATVDKEALDGHKNGFQVVYEDENDRKIYLLYLVASSSGDRHEWMNAITAEAVRAGAPLSHYYHRGVWTKTTGQFSCCGQISRNAEGCTEHSENLFLASPSPRPSSSSSSSSDDSRH